MDSFSSIQTIPKELRNILQEKFDISSLNLEKERLSSDGTRKFLFNLNNGGAVESVLISAEFIGKNKKINDNDSINIENDVDIRKTLCVSSQVGCALGCSFCATGKLNLIRNLEPAEIVDQVMMVEKITGEKISNIVFMGMGEPLQNFNNVVKAIDILTNPKNKLISRKKITVSTSGIVPKIYELAKLKKPVKLAVSLHSTDNNLRRKLMPVAEKWDIKTLRESIVDYYRTTGVPITYEYILFDGLNDTENDVKRLAKFVRSVPSKVNIIPFHDIGFVNPQGFASQLKPASYNQILDFATKLKNAGVNVFIRTSSGHDIEAACGQLAFEGKINTKHQS